MRMEQSPLNSMSVRRLVSRRQGRPRPGLRLLGTQVKPGQNWEVLSATPTSWREQELDSWKPCRLPVQIGVTQGYAIYPAHRSRLLRNSLPIQCPATHL